MATRLPSFEIYIRTCRAYWGVCVLRIENSKKWNHQISFQPTYIKIGHSF